MQRIQKNWKEFKRIKNHWKTYIQEDSINLFKTLSSFLEVSLFLEGLIMEKDRDWWKHTPAHFNLERGISK